MMPQGQLAYTISANGNSCTFNGVVPLLPQPGSPAGTPAPAATISGTLSVNGPTSITSSVDKDADGNAENIDVYNQNTDGSKSDDFKALTDTGGTQYEQLTNTTAAGAVTATISGQGAEVNLNNATVTLTDGASATITGTNNIALNTIGNDTLSLANADHVAIAASGYSLTASSSTLSVSITGLNNAVTANGVNNTVLVNGNNNTTIATGRHDDPQCDYQQARPQPPQQCQSDAQAQHRQHHQRQQQTPGKVLRCAFGIELHRNAACVISRQKFSVCQNNSTK